MNKGVKMTRLHVSGLESDLLQCHNIIVEQENTVYLCHGGVVVLELPDDVLQPQFHQFQLGVDFYNQACGAACVCVCWW